MGILKPIGDLQHAGVSHTGGLDVAPGHGFELRQEQGLPFDPLAYDSISHLDGLLVEFIYAHSLLDLHSPGGQVMLSPESGHLQGERTSLELLLDLVLASEVMQVLV